MGNKIVAIASHGHSALVSAISSALQNEKDFVVNNHEVKDQMRQHYLNSNPEPLKFTITSTNSLEPKSGRENRRERRAMERNKKRKP